MRFNSVFKGLIEFVLLIFLRVRRIGFVMSVRPPFRMEQLGPHLADFYDISYSRKKLKFDCNMTSITGTLHEKQCTFMTSQ